MFCSAWGATVLEKKSENKRKKQDSVEKKRKIAKPIVLKSIWLKH